MPDIAWPSTLPEVIAPGYQAQDQDGLIRTQMDAGPVKVRRRYTACVEKISCSVVLDASELAIFDNFYRGTAARGARRFLMAHPVTGVLREFRFTEPPQKTETDGLFNVSLKLEALT